MAKDMRSWIKQLEEAGELVRMKEEVDPKANMSAYLWSSKEKALLFENVKNHPGWKVLGQAPANMRHVGLGFRNGSQTGHPGVCAKGGPGAHPPENSGPWTRERGHTNGQGCPSHQSPRSHPGTEGCRSLHQLRVMYRQGPGDRRPKHGLSQDTGEGRQQDRNHDGARAPQLI